MALQSAFRERLAAMDSTRNQRVSLLQAEKDTQTNKSLLLSAKLANIRSLEQRCLVLDHKLALQNFKISSLKSEIEFLDRKYQCCSQQFRALKVEVEELEQLQKEREKYYGLKCSEMEKFNNEATNKLAEIRSVVQELRHRRDELKSRCIELQTSNKANIQAAKTRNLELMASMDKVANILDSNKKVRAELEKQLLSLR